MSVQQIHEIVRLDDRISALKAALHALAQSYEADAGCLGRDCPACRAMEMVKDNA